MRGRVWAGGGGIEPSLGVLRTRPPGVRGAITASSGFGEKLSLGGSDADWLLETGHPMGVRTGSASRVSRQEGPT